jgi:hypothetical protein
MVRQYFFLSLALLAIASPSYGNLAVVMEPAEVRSTTIPRSKLMANHKNAPH